MRIRLKGVTLAQIAVAKMHSGGYGAAQDNVRAHKWFSIAAELGDYHAAGCIPGRVGAFTRPRRPFRMSAWRFEP